MVLQESFKERSKIPGASRSGAPGPRCCGFLKILTCCVIRVTGLDAAYVMDLALEHDCVVDVFDLGLDIYTNDFESPEAGWQGRVKFHRCRVFKNTQPPLSPIPPLPAAGFLTHV